MLLLNMELKVLWGGRARARERLPCALEALP